MEPGAVEGEKLYNAQIKEKTPAASAPRSSKVAKKKTPGAPPAAKVVHSSYMDPLVKEIRTSIRTIENMMDSTAGGKFADPSTKKAVQDLLSEWNAFKGLKADKATIDSLAEELVKKVDEAQVVERKAKTKLVLSRQKQVTDDLKTIDDKAVADAEAKAKTGGVDPDAAENARIAVEDARPDADTPAAKRVSKWSGKFSHNGKKISLSGGQAGEFFNSLSAKEKKQVLDALGNPEEVPKGARLRNAMGSIPEIKKKAIEYRKSLVKGATTTAAPKPDAPKADAPKPPATTTAAPTKKGKRPNSNKTLDATYKYVSEKTGKSVSALKKAAAKAKGGKKPYLFSLLNPGQQAELNDPNYGKTPPAQTPSAKKAAESRAGKPATVITPATADTLKTGIVGDKTPEALRARADELEAHAKMRDKGRNARGSSATNKGEGFPANKEIAADLREEAKGLRERAAEAESGKPPTQARQAAASKKAPSPRPSPNQIDEKPATQAKAKAKAKAKVPASPGPDAWHRGDMTSRQKAADTRLRKERARVARMEKIEADMKAGEPKRKAKAERIKTNKANRKSVAEVFESEGLTPEQAKTKAGREAVDDMRKIQGKKGVLESSKKPLTKLQKAARVAGDVTRANRIPPGVLNKLGTAFRLAGSAAGVYEVGRMSYRINEKGLAQAMRDDDVGTPIVGYVEKKTRAPGMGKLPKAVEDRSKAREISTKSTIPRRPTYTRADAIRREDGGKKAAADAKRDVAMLAQLSKEKDLRGAVKQALMNNPLTGAEEIEKDAKWHKAQDAKIAKVKARQAKRKAKRKVAAARKPKVSKSDAVQARIQRVLKRSREEARRKPGKAREAAAPVDASRPRPTRHAWIPTTRPESQAEARSSQAAALERMKRVRADADVKKAMAAKSKSKSIKEKAEKARKEARRSADRIFPTSELNRLLRDD